MNKLANMREDYMLKSLDINDVLINPFDQFKIWFDEALNSKIPEPNAMTLATATKDGLPSARIVLLKGIENGGFVFYTNYESRKGQEMGENPNVALVFCWLELQRQIRIEGTVVKTTKKQSEEYFQSRPRESQIGAWSSPQSTTIGSRQIIEDNVNAIKNKFESIEKIPVPKFWGGYIVKPTAIEFWQGRSSRLHDRIRYQKIKRSWKIERLAP
jgi:pyridoxamine 5'-phosphate oxidase